AGVVFWQPTRAAAREPRRRGAEVAAEQIEVYAPGPLSPGEAAALEATFVASLGRAFAAPGRGWPLRAWWLGGVVAALLLAPGAPPPASTPSSGAGSKRRPRATWGAHRGAGASAGPPAGSAPRRRTPWWRCAPGDRRVRVRGATARWQRAARRPAGGDPRFGC